MIIISLFKRYKGNIILLENKDKGSKKKEVIYPSEKEESGLLDNPKPTHSKNLYIENFKILQNKFQSFIQEISIYNHTHIYSDKIFSLWLQGVENIPELAQACLNSVKFHCQNHEMILLTETTLDKYIHIPNYILEKYKNGNITKTHFSDIIRIELLIKN